MVKLRQLKPDEARKKLLPAMWTDKNYIAEYKYNGVHYLMHLGNKSSRFTSRHVSVVTGKFVEKTENFPHLAQHKFSRSLWDTVFDGEITHKDNVYDVLSVTGASPAVAVAFQKKHGWVNYTIWDILFYRGKNVRKLPWHERHELLEYAIEIFNCKYIKIPKVVRRNKLKYYTDILRAGGEGVVLKHVDHLYGTKSWVKAKRVETYDVVVTGYKPPTRLTEKADGTVSVSKFYALGWIGSIEFEERDGNGFGSCSGMKDSVREYISNNRARCVGKLFEIKVQEKLPSGKFQSPRFNRWRPDK